MNTTCTMSESMAASSSSIQCIAPRLLSPFDWQTLSKWFCLPYALHVWPHAGHICDLSSDPAPSCWWVLQLLHAFWWVVVFIMVPLCLCVVVSWAMFWACLCRLYADIWSPAMSEALDILSWSHMAISNALVWLIFYSRVFNDPALSSMSNCRASLAMPWMNWSLIYMLDRSWLQLGHMKSQYCAPDHSWTK